MKRDSAIVAAVVLIYTILAKGMEWFGIVNLSGVNDIIILTLFALGAVMFLIWNDPEVWDE